MDNEFTNFDETLVMNGILSGAIGGVITGLILPGVSYFVIRFINNRRTFIIIEPKIENTAHGYTIIKLRVWNRSFSTLKNVIPYISLEYPTENILDIPAIPSYTVNTSNQPMMLSWAKVVDGKNLPNIDINQFESPDLNLFRFHSQQKYLDCLEIASELGFAGNGGRKGRVNLKPDRDYEFEILITAENMLPIKKEYKLSISTLEINPA